MKKKLFIIIPILVLTAVLSVIYLRSRDSVKAGDILIRSSVKEMTVSLDDLEMTNVSGEVRNKKGETKQIDSEGIAISKIPSIAGVSEYTVVSVYADDEYNATLTKEELDVPDKAWLIKTGDGARLIVFDDPDSKRDVKNVVRIEIK